MTTISFSGVGSGNDWSSLIDSLVTAEKVPATLITTRKTNAGTQLSLVSDLVTRLGNLSSKADGFTAASSLWGTQVTSGDTTRLKATASGTSSPGTYALTVGKLAQGETRQGQALVSGGAGAAGDGSISIAVGAGAAVKVDYTSADSLADIAARINSSVSGVTAAAVYDGTSYRLALASQATGKTNGMSISETGSGLGLADPASIVQAADDATVTLNGVTARKPSNHITDLIPGVTLDLQSQTPGGGAATLVTVAKDPSALVQKVNDLVAAYNSVNQLVTSQMSYTGTVRGEDTLFGDPIIAGLHRGLGAPVATGYTHGSGQVGIADAGISINADGSLAVDATKLAGKIASDPSAIEDLLSGPNGLAAALKTMADGYTSVTGPLLSRKKSLTDQMAAYDKQIEEINDRAAQLQTRLKNQFASLDALMGTYSANMSYINAISNTTKTGG